ncbi:unnamed protein product [Closterium sp. NIES-54]
MGGGWEAAGDEEAEYAGEPQEGENGGESEHAGVEVDGKRVGRRGKRKGGEKVGEETGGLEKRGKEMGGEEKRGELKEGKEKRGGEQCGKRQTQPTTFIGVDGGKQQEMHAAGEASSRRGKQQVRQAAGEASSRTPSRYTPLKVSHTQPPIPPPPNPSPIPLPIPSLPFTSPFLFLPPPPTELLPPPNTHGAMRGWVLLEQCSAEGDFRFLLPPHPTHMEQYDYLPPSPLLIRITRNLPFTQSN